VVKKVFSTFLLIGLLFPTITEAGVSPEGRPNRPRNYFPEGKPRKKKCKGSGGVLVCRVPKRKKCTIKRPCIPKGYYRNNPPRLIPMG
tara:strand:- start:578 stop:841 length:264 start_codon:yes stop_codon:yes gene_type:complete